MPYPKWDLYVEVLYSLQTSWMKYTKTYSEQRQYLGVCGGVVQLTDQLDEIYKYINKNIFRTETIFRCMWRCCTACRQAGCNTNTNTICMIEETQCLGVCGGVVQLADQLDEIYIIQND